MVEVIISICLGIGLAASAGFRIFIPLLVLSIAGYMQWIPLQENWQWVGSMTAIIVLAVATVIELAAYFIPYVDNILDTLSIPLASVAGTVIMFTVLGDVDPIYSWALAIIAGGGTAAAIASTTGAARATSTSITAGIGNPIISFMEAIASFLVSIISLIAPVLGLLTALLTLFAIGKLYRYLRRRNSLSRKRTHHDPMQ